MGSFALRPIFCLVRLTGLDGELKEEVELNVYIYRGQNVSQGSNFRVREDSSAERNQKHEDD